MFALYSTVFLPRLGRYGVVVEIVTTNSGAPCYRVALCETSPAEGYFTDELVLPCSVVR